MTMRARAAWVVLMLVGCPDDDDGAGDSTTSSATSDASSSSETGTFCVPGEQMSCVCHQGSTEGTMTCLPDGSAYGPCEGECACPQGRSDGCCAGDGICCPCVQGCDPSTSFEQDPETDALIACICAGEVCVSECENECAGQGIGADCAPCVEQAGMDACMAEYLACQP